MKTIPLLGMTAFLLAACSGTVDSRYYLLSTVPPSASAAPGAKAVAVSAVHLPGVLDRPELVVRTGAETVDILEFDRWAEPLDQMVPRVLAQDLSSRLPAAASSDGSERRLHVVIDEFMSDQAGGARLAGKWWTLERDQTSAAKQEHGFVLATSTSGGQGRQIAAALSSLLGQLADDIARE